MIDQYFAVDSKCLVKPLFIVLALPGDIAHGKEEGILQPLCLSGSHHPEISQRLMAPQKVAVAFLVQFSDADTVLIRRHLFGDDIHTDLGEIHIGPDANCGGNSCHP